MNDALHQLTIDAPDGFARAETTVSFRAPSIDHLKDARVLRTQKVTRANLMTHQRPLRPGEDLEAAVAHAVRELDTVLSGVDGLEVAALVFADGRKGSLLTYEVRLAQAHVLRQMQAIRIDADVITTLTMTSSADIDESQREAYLACLKSARSSPPRPLEPR